jgi:hypothetical protein
VREAGNKGAIRRLLWYVRVGLGAARLPAAGMMEGLQSAPDRGRKGLVTLVFFFPAARARRDGESDRPTGTHCTVVQ